MGLILSQTTWLQQATSLLVANSPIQTEWYNAEVLNGAQMFLKYSSVANVAVNLHLSPADAYGRCGIDPANAYDTLAALASGANGGEGFFFPAAPSIFDRPFASWRLELVLSANITLCYFAYCANAAEPG